MSEPFVGEIRMFAGNFAPRSWAFCDGQLLAVSQNDALFSLLGTTYGGDGRTTFGLPDLRGRIPIHQGSGPGLSPRNLGGRGGTERQTLSINELPSHTHGPKASASSAETTTPSTTVQPAVASGQYYEARLSAAAMNSSSIGRVGGSEAHNNVQPFQCINYIIALFGIYPSRN